MMVNLIKCSEFNLCILVFYANHCFLTYHDDNIPTSAANFVYNGAFDVARSGRNVSEYCLLRDVKLAYNKHSDIAH